MLQQAPPGEAGGHALADARALLAAIREVIAGNLLPYQIRTCSGNRPHPLDLPTAARNAMRLHELRLWLVPLQNAKA